MEHLSRFRARGNCVLFPQKAHNSLRATGKGHPTTDPKLILSYCMYIHYFTVSYATASWLMYCSSTCRWQQRMNSDSSCWAASSRLTPARALLHSGRACAWGLCAGGCVQGICSAPSVCVNRCTTRSVHRPHVNDSTPALGYGL